ncbi:hypothetical protein C479_05863 [Halovivax asiaticus JCM 14624]|uniref:Pvc16 N-terminal domain-containing protein n=1 Tax=Halovivax asiaticus JCM 14624 TaxID=1227490 RepID=M0BN69_9EURY|nr:DUF4255 domain-containing protein [Halovivax asiaticus]ELZ12310.1 hypothetical protein C479_05863 [Halovivax asiaticus JCM 14624]
MGSPSAFRDLTTLLLDVLQARLAGGDDPLVEEHQVKPLSPAAMDDDSNVRVGLYLHAVSTDTGRTSEPPEIDDGHKTRPPLRLEGHYLLTVFPDPTLEEEGNGVLDQHEVLGTAMQALYDNSVIEPDNVPPSIGDQQLTVSHDDLDEGEALDLWRSFTEGPKQPCATYRVGPISIDSTQRTAFERVNERDVRVSRDEDPAGATDTTGN